MPQLTLEQKKKEKKPQKYVCIQSWLGRWIGWILCCINTCFAQPWHQIGRHTQRIPRWIVSLKRKIIGPVSDIFLENYCQQLLPAKTKSFRGYYREGIISKQLQNISADADHDAGVGRKSSANKCKRFLQVQTMLQV